MQSNLQFEKWSYVAYRRRDLKNRKAVGAQEIGGELDLKHELLDSRSVQNKVVKTIVTWPPKREGIMSSTVSPSTEVRRSSAGKVM